MSRTHARKLAAVTALAVPALGALAAPALGAVTHPNASVARSSTLDSRGEGTCQAWRPVVPGLLYVGTAPLLTIGSLSLLGSGTCLPYGRDNNVEIGVNLAIPPGSFCAPAGFPPLLRISLGLAVGPTDPDGHDPCQATATAPIAPRQSPVASVAPAKTPVAPPVRPAQPVSPTPIRLPPPLRPVRHIPPPITPTPPPALVTAPAHPSAPAPIAIALPPPGHTPPAPRANLPAQARPPALGSPGRAIPPAVAAPPTRPAQQPAHGKPAHGKPAPRPAGPAHAPPVRAVPFPRAEAQRHSAAAFTPGKPVMPVGVLVTVVMTPCIATVVARLGRVLVGR